MRGADPVVIGCIERGKVKMGDEVEVVGLAKQVRGATILAVEIFNRRVAQAQAGDSVGLQLRGVEPAHLRRGQVLAAPGSIRPCTRFESSVYVLAADECGRHTPFSTGYRPQFCFHTASVPGTIALPPDVEMCRPGDNATLTVQFREESPIAIEEGDGFVIREGDRPVGSGVVTRLLE
jgi:elongation factor Tu